MKLRILQIIQRPQRRGAEIFACQLSMELIQLGHEVDVLYLFDAPENQLKFDLNFIGLNAHENRRFWDFVKYRQLADIIRKGRYDVVQANAGDTLKYAVLSKKIHKWKTPLIFRNANKMSAFIRGQFHYRLNRWFLSQCDYYISVSENCRIDLIGLYEKAREKSKTITIGTYHFEHIDALQRNDENTIFINIGGLVPEKNHLYLIDVFNAIRSDYPNARLWLVGDGKQRKAIEEHIAALSLEQYVKLWGNRKDAISLLKASDVMIMPSLIEGLPGVILEAMSCGIPVIATDVGGIGEVVLDRKTGILIEDWKSESFEKAIHKILDDINFRQLIVKNARELVDERFLLPNIAEEFLRTYSSLVK
ncbi:glycosyltransferase family 4 protein [Fulvivirga sedimenti]|uniref:Glycosyltransferase family 4 protein n=1 Tax=Fulvivirga sedimenti TaxID=2879465 RepID=A0A9X1HLD0_9BACT|nr:glycosyltransferase family 4 protein [Fulvivirga sedimenti]MCA6073421.1 glycosyltransferase family 4 protein [Fulvivirga sedimenti]